MLIKLIENLSNEECIINTDHITSMRSGEPHTTTIHLVDGRYVEVARPISEIITTIEKGGNIYDTEGEA